MYATDKKKIILTKGDQIEAWATLSQACRAHNLPYKKLVYMCYPFEYRGVLFQSIKYKKKRGIQFDDHTDKDW